MLNWTRNDGDPTDFWFDVLQIVDNEGSLNKELSLQVPGSGSPSGSMPFVFVRTGPHIIRGTTAESPNGFFNSTIPITAIAANSSTSSSSSSSSPSISYTSSSDPSTSHTSNADPSTLHTSNAEPSTSHTSNAEPSTSPTNSSLVIGATIGSVVPTVLIFAVLAVFCMHRRMRKRKDIRSRPRKLRSARSSAYELTSFPQAPHAAASDLFNERPSQSLNRFSTRSASSFYPPSPGFPREMMSVPRSQTGPGAPSTEAADVNSARFTWSSQASSARTAKSRLETSVSPPPPPTESQ
ncbi:hypothetical protein GYMLUDRAFT_248855 [Collybiopsis luxurians FD-317 M1]|uniref:Unplaced genomic scaffold GYMLUscaffold_60, whole genome shotgun sequence n=1 Tax=Collybiopsis luxurians FD-317 M1 TaxID=944289 RepID=A0A0D0CJN7_9AGAR|nr:hypothetical protein GYMLUDRAFT_248855 [Collybiopsis luxurians FD-317 M1]